MLTEQETSDMHRMVTEMEDRSRAADVYLLGRLAETTGDDWDTLARACLVQWRTITSTERQSSDSAGAGNET